MKKEYPPPRFVRYIVALVACFVFFAGGVWLLFHYFRQIPSFFEDENFFISFSRSSSISYNLEKGLVTENGIRPLWPEDPLEIVTLATLRSQEHPVAFFAEADSPEGSSLSFQVSYDLQTWSYFDGEAWVDVGDCSSCANSAEEIDAAISLLPFPHSQLRIKAILLGSIDALPVLKGVGILTPPEQFSSFFTAARAANDRSNVQVSGVCEGGIARFTVYNRGNGDMSVPAEYRIYRSDVLESSAMYQLVRDGSLEVNVAGNGELLRLEADQTPGHAHETSQHTIKKCSGDSQTPVAVDDLVQTEVTQSIVISVLANDSDADGVLVPSTLSLVTFPEQGVVTIDSVDGTFLYEPSVGASGTDVFTYRICDNDSLCATAQVTVFLLFPPDVVDDVARVVVGEETSISVLSNDTDADGLIDPSTLRVVTQPLHGDALVQGGVVLFTSSGEFFGDDSLTYEVCDDDGLCGEALLTLTVLSPPRAFDDGAETSEDTPVSLAVLENDEDVDGTLDISTLRVVSFPEHGLATVVDDFVLYSPSSGYFGSDTFSYEICDNDALCDVGVVTIAIDSQLPPIANDDNVTAIQDTSLEVDVLENDFDLDDGLDVNTLSIVSLPLYGEAFINLPRGTITYTPSLGFAGSDIFSYEICDSNDGLCDRADVVVYVESRIAPTASDDSAVVTGGVAVSIQVLENDWDVDGELDPSSLEVITDAVHGITTVDFSLGSITYAPFSDLFNGEDSFTYRICDNHGLCDEALVVVYVHSFFAPFVQDDEAETPRDTAIEIAVLSNDSDSDGVIDLSSLFIVSSPLHGDTVVDETRGFVLYTPTTDYIGPDAFIYTVCDDDALCSSATVQVIVLAPPHVVDDIVAGERDASVIIRVLDNDFDEDGTLDVSSLSLASFPESGSVDVDTTAGILTFMPALGWTGNAVFRYRICDNDGLCQTAQVTVSVESPLPPLVEDDAYVIQKNTSLRLLVTENDRDLDGALNLSSLVITRFPSMGAVTVGEGTGEVLFTPYLDVLGSDSFEYTLCDDEGLCDSAIVSLSIEDVPEVSGGGGGGAGGFLSPRLRDDYAETVRGTSVTMRPLANDEGSGGAQLNFSSLLLGKPESGNVSISLESGEVIYTPDSSAVGQVRFSYYVCDTNDLCASANITILVLVPPRALFDEVTAGFLQDVRIPVLLNDFDSDGSLDFSSLRIIEDPDYGDARVVRGGEIVYRSFSGDSFSEDALRYEICDNDGFCAQGDVHISFPFPVSFEIPEAGDSFILPPLTFAPPSLSVTSSLLAFDTSACNAVYTQEDPVFTLSLASALPSTSLVSYTLNDGQSWNAATLDLSGQATISPSFSRSGSYILRARTLDSTGEALASLPCSFEVVREIVIGGVSNSFFGQPAPLAEGGEVQAIAHTPLEVFVEVVGATQVSLVDEADGRTVDLFYDDTLALWTGSFTFVEEGSRTLRLVAQNSQERVDRLLEHVRVVSGSSGEAGDLLSAESALFLYDPGAEKFIPWEGGIYGQEETQLFSPAEGASYSLYPGQYYARVRTEDEGSTASNIVEITERDVLSVSIDDQGDVLLTSSLASSSARELSLSETSALVEELSSSIDTSGPTLVALFNSWDMQGAMTINTLEALQNVPGSIDVVPFVSLQPESLTDQYLQRGNYELEVENAPEDFLQSLPIAVTPAFYFFDPDMGVFSMRFGPQTARDIEEWIGDLAP